MTEPTYINLDEIVVSPRIITVGDLSLDSTKIDAFNSFRLLKFYNEDKGIITNPDEALAIITDMVNTQQETALTPEDMLKKIGTNAKLIGLQIALTDEILKTYRLAKGDDTPLEAIMNVVRPPSTSTK